MKSALFEAMTDILSNLGDDAQAIALASEHQAFVAARMGKRHLRYVGALLQEASARRAYGQEGLALERLVLAEAVLDELHDQDSIVRGRLLILKGTLLDKSNDDTGTNLALRGVKMLEARRAPAVERAQALLGIGYRLTQLGRVVQALDVFNSAVKTAKGFDGAPLIEARAWSTRAGALLSVERVSEAIESQRRAVRSAQELPSAHPEIARQILMLGGLLHRHGERAEGRRHIF